MLFRSRRGVVRVGEGERDRGLPGGGEESQRYGGCGRGAGRRRRGWWGLGLELLGVVEEILRQGDQLLGGERGERGGEGGLWGKKEGEMGVYEEA